MKSRIFSLVLLALVIQACGGGKHDAVTPAPSKATLVAPAQNAACITGTVVSANQSSVQFAWNTSANTDSYNLVLKNLLTTDSTTQSTTSTSLNLTIDQDTPYSWYIVSKSSSGIATSAVWKFYNSGPGVVTYPPYPAEITAPTFGQTVTASSGTVNLTWAGSAVVSGTIVNYDIYFGTTTIPAILKSDVTDSFLDNVSVTSGTTYYWRVVTRDVNGNTSDSGLYQFTVN